MAYISPKTSLFLHHNQYFLALLFGTVGAIANLFPIELAFNISLLVGNTAYIVAASFLRPNLTLLCALVSVIPLYFHWGHPFGFVTFGLEAWFISTLRARGWYVITADLLYWLLIGMPLTAVLIWFNLESAQSYFLFSTTREQLNFLRFPLGNLKKTETREIAHKLDLNVADKPDSQDICFVTSSSYRDLINKLKPELNIEGNFLDSEGSIIGKHKGIANYTIGQRRGLGVGGSEFPLYVVNIDKKNNQIFLGDQNLLKKTVISLDRVNWLDDSVSKTNLRCSAKIRSTQKEASGLLNIDSNSAEFTFDEEINTTSPGQACVLYLGEQVLGGGWITKTSN